MKRVKPDQMGSEPMSKLLIQQALPASIGILAMSLNMLIDTIFVGHWIGPLAIAAITVVSPIIFLMSSTGMAIGVGGSSILARALGRGQPQKACDIFANQLLMSFSLVVAFLCISLMFKSQVLQIYGAAGRISRPADTFFSITLLSVPFLAFAMTSNPVIRAEGNARVAMTVMLVPSFGNLVLDIVFIKFLRGGLAGAAWATSLSYLGAALYILYYFLSGQSHVKLRRHAFRFDGKILSEIASLGFVTLARQGLISILAIVVNNTLYYYGQETAVTLYGIISRLMLFALFPMLGVTQGFLPIAGYNYGAGKYERVKQSIAYAVGYSTAIALVIFLIIIGFPKAMVQIFTTDPEIIQKASHAIRWVFAATPILGTEFIGSAYFQAIGKAVKALFLTALRQGFFLIPLILSLPRIWDIDGVWYAFPIADLLSSGVISVSLYLEIKRRLH